MGKYGKNMRDCCDSVAEPYAMHMSGCPNYKPLAPQPPGITITLGYSKVYNGLHLQKWENHGLSEGTYRLVLVEDGE